MAVGILGQSVLAIHSNNDFWGGTAHPGGTVGTHFGCSIPQLEVIHAKINFLFFAAPVPGHTPPRTISTTNGASSRLSPAATQH